MTKCFLSGTLRYGKQKGEKVKMHVCQIMLIEADSSQDAIDYATSTITYAEERYPAWSDWHGGLGEGLAGRWSGLFQGWEDTRDVLGYTENPTLAEDIIKDWLNGRTSEIARCKSMLEKTSIDEMITAYNTDKSDFGDVGMNAWTLTRLGKLLSNYWCSDSGLYDLTAHTASLEYFRERLAKEPDKQFLVPIDFHF